MCARRFLIIVFVLTLLVVAGAFAVFQFGQEVLIRQATPQGRFEPPPQESGPDFAQDASWIARPSFADDPSRWLPDGYVQATVPKGESASVFYIHPTTYLLRLSRKAPNAAWRYRGAFLLKSEDASAALDLAYRDVTAAFDSFLKDAPQDRPLVLAGHSQGALHLVRLLRERVAGTPLQRRVAAAYVVGWPLSRTADVPALGLPACRAADQSGCLLSWLSFAEPANPDLVVESYQGSAGLAGGERRREDILCVNPLTGAQDGAAPPAANPGTLVPTADMRAASLLPTRVGAACDKGLLILNGEVPAMGPYVLPGNNYHVYDYALFWAAIRNDAVRRVAAWR
jgi:hypothetical protein